MTAVSSKDGEFDTSTTTDAPARTSARPAPERVSTPEDGEAATASWPCAASVATTSEPISPVPPMTTIFMVFLLERGGPWAVAACGTGPWSRPHPGVDPAPEDVDPVGRPGAVAGHRAVLQPLQDVGGVPADVVGGPQVEGEEHRPAVVLAEQRTDVCGEPHRLGPRRQDGPLPLLRPGCRSRGRR